MIVNGVFEGGGVKGISLVGAVQAAERHGVVFERVAGTSSGSIVATLLAAGYRAEDMKRAIELTPFSSLLRRSRLFGLKPFGPAIRLLMKKGLYSGDALREWISGLLAARGVRTFADLPPGKLQIIASDITNGRLLVLPKDIAAYGIVPEFLPVADAVRMSTSIPYFFDPVRLYERPPLPQRTNGKERPRRKQIKSAYIVDGGLLSNFPLWLFDPKEGESQGLPAIGFQMVGRLEAQPRRISGPISMFEAMFSTMLGAHDERYIEQHNRLRTVKIPTLGIATTDFRLSAEDSERLYRSGLEAGNYHFSHCNRTTGLLEEAKNGPDVRRH
ncbi:patatin-like phospholipase family protein [Cohnella zeiphila]|uniref:Patatin-like phospholipase family protein n=1 Tax=Cohnella zeiphila TaxID=2761120 RepID=A0A7X0SIC9_9BACL|nr:patatin-like phospholipase family protein [Cohnella zeiphila]MBB6730546.1 patatin-like phospholipase family protein [Cohnella zeiphila]